MRVEVTQKAEETTELDEEIQKAEEIAELAGETQEAEETTELAEVGTERQLSLSPGTSQSRMTSCFSRAEAEVV